MPETKYIREFKDGVEVNRIPYEVSDEELQAEADDARLKAICGMAHSAIPVPILAEAIALICSKLGYT